MAPGPKRAPGRCDVPPSNGAPTMTTSAPAKLSGSSTVHGGTPRNVMSGPYMAPYRSLTDPPRRPVRGEQVQERHGIQRLRAEYPGPVPGARGEQLQRHHRVDGGLPDHRLVPVLLHRPLVVDHVV